MSAENIPIAVWEGSFDVLGTTIRAYVLEDGRRILNTEDVDVFLDADRDSSGDTGDVEGLHAMVAFCKGAPI